MDKVKYFRWKFFLLIICTFIFLCIISVKTPVTFRSNPGPYGLSRTCPFHVSDQTITPLKDTKHLLVSAFMDQRVQGFDIRIIGLFRIDSIQPLHCRFCCAGFLSITTPANILQHPEKFGFPFVTTDVMCPIPENCNATHVTLLTQPESGIAPKQIWLPITNRKTNMDEEEKLQFNFTVCISSLFADYNNVLQFAQTLEMYRAVEQTSVHEVLKQFNETFKVPMEVCRIINCQMIYPKSRLELLHVDTRLWDFSDDLLTSVMKMLRRAGLLSSEVEGRQIG